MEDGNLKTIAKPHFVLIMIPGQCEMAAYCDSNRLDRMKIKMKTESSIDRTVLNWEWAYGDHGPIIHN